MKGLRRILLVSWTSKKSNEWVLNKARVKRELLNTLKARKLAGQRDNARNNARCTEARKTTHGLDGQHQDMGRTLRGHDRMTEDRDKWRKYVHGVANPRIEDG